MSLSKESFDMEPLIASKGIEVIPMGVYCSGCPYSDYDDEREEQSNGYCWFMGQGDWDINQEEKWESRETSEIESANEIGLPMSLLWDGCKECGINIEYDNQEGGEYDS